MKVLFAASLLILFSSISLSRNLADKDWYLIDSELLLGIESHDLESLDSVLSCYHQAQDPLNRLNQLLEISNVIVASEIWFPYTYMANQSLLRAYFSGKYTEDKRLEILQLYGESLNDIGYFHDISGEHLHAIDLYQHALEVNELSDYQKGKVNSYVNLGASYHHLHEIETAKSYYEKALRVDYHPNDPELTCFIYNNLAVIYDDLGELDQALSYHFLSLQMSRQNQLIFNEGMSLNNIAGIYINKFSDSLDLAKGYLNEALDLFEKADRTDWLAYTHQRFIYLYKKLDQFEAAEKHANFSLFYAQQGNHPEVEMRAFKALYDLKKETGQYNVALQYFEKYTKLKENLTGEALKAEARIMEIQYQHEKSVELAEKEHESSLAIATAEKETKDLLLGGVLIVLVIILIFSIILLSRLKKIREQKKKLEKQNLERTLLIKEVHHRVKNNFQIICSVLKLQCINEEDERIHKAFEDAINRIRSMSEVHEMIYKNESFVDILPQQYFEKLTGSIQHFSMTNPIAYKVNSEVNKLNVDAMLTLGIAVNELITNSVKYAFNQPMLNPEINIGLYNEGNKVALKYSDNGIGFDMKEIQQSFGTELITTIIDQLNGKLDYEQVQKGMSVKILFDPMLN